MSCLQRDIMLVFNHTDLRASLPSNKPFQDAIVVHLPILMSVTVSLILSSLPTPSPV